MSKLLSVLTVLWFVMACMAWDVRSSFNINLRPEDIVLLVMAGLILQKNLFGARIFCFSKLLLVVISFAIFLICLSFIAYLLNVIFDSSQSTLGTFGLSVTTEMLKEYMRMFKYIMIVFVFSNIDKNVFKLSMITVAACCAVIIIIQLLQYAQVEGVNELLCLLYGEGDDYFAGRVSATNKGAIDLGLFRSGSIFGNPNVMGGFLVAPGIILTMQTVRALKVHEQSIVRRACLLAITCFIWMGVFMTQSRTALIACIAAFLVGIVSARRYFNLKMKDFIAGMGAIIVLLVIMLSIFSGKMTRYTSDYNSKEIGGGSMSSKIEWTINDIADLEIWQLLIGRGPAQSGMVDNEIGYMIIWYGFMGFIAYLSFFFILYKVVINRIADVDVRAAFVGMLAAYALLAVSSSVFLNIKIFPVFMALLAVAVVSKYKHEGTYQNTYEGV